LVPSSGGAQPPDRHRESKPPDAPIDVSPLAGMLRPNPAHQGPAPLAGSDVLGLLHLDAVKKELGLKASQLDSLDELMREQRQELGKLVAALRDVETQTDPQRVKEIFQTAKELQTFVQRVVDNEILSPSQRQRLQQIALQRDIEQRGLLPALLSGELAEQLELAPHQRDELREAEAVIRAELEKELQRLKDEARRKLISNLSPQQRAKLQAILGEPFAVEQAK
jgi:hypothetical protein